MVDVRPGLNRQTNGRAAQRGSRLQRELAVRVFVYKRILITVTIKGEMIMRPIGRGVLRVACFDEIVCLTQPGILAPGQGFPEVRVLRRDQSRELVDRVAEGGGRSGLG